LFKSSSGTANRNELIVLIRPTVLPTPEVAALAAQGEKQKMPGVRRAEIEAQAEEDARLLEQEKFEQKNQREFK
jgi:type II secretory pathway component GspD/PulD (secretin)